MEIQANAMSGDKAQPTDETRDAQAGGFWRSCRQWRRTLSCSKKTGPGTASYESEQTLLPRMILVSLMELDFGSVYPTM
jgi:hypothetical protein